MTEKVGLVNVSNLAAFAVEWVSESGTRYTLVNARGTSGLSFGAKRDDKSSWSNRPVVDPSQFGMTKPPKSYKEFLTIAESYVNG
jgi:hypothetical protein